MRMHQLPSPSLNAEPLSKLIGRANAINRLQSAQPHAEPDRSESAMNRATMAMATGEGRVPRVPKLPSQPDSGEAVPRSKGARVQLQKR
jgi:hypothetical protein